MGLVYATHVLTRKVSTLGGDPADDDITKSHPAAVTSSDTTDVKTIAVPVDANMVILSCEDNDVLLRLDGTAAAASGPGQIIRAGASPYYCPLLPPLGAASAGVTTRKPLSFISMAASPATLRAVFGQ